MSENQMFRNLAGNLPGRGERLRDNSELYKIPEGGNFQTWLSWGVFLVVLFEFSEKSVDLDLFRPL